jgi:hypothetical protein
MSEYMNISRALLEDFKRFAVQEYKENLIKTLQQYESSEWVIEIIEGN